MYYNLNGFISSIFLLSSYTSGKRLITRMYRELKRLNSPKINGPMKKWANKLNRAFFKGRGPNGRKAYEEMLNIPGQKRNTNQNHTKILPHSCWNGYHEEHEQ
jgi:hypothetical protein